MYRVGAGSDRLAKTLRPKKEQLRVDLSAGRLSPRVRQELLNRAAAIGRATSYFPLLGQIPFGLQVAPCS
jgi:hypothetical protein